MEYLTTALYRHVIIIVIVAITMVIIVKALALAIALGGLVSYIFVFLLTVELCIIDELREDTIRVDHIHGVIIHGYVTNVCKRVQRSPMSLTHNITSNDPPSSQKKKK